MEHMASRECTTCIVYWVGYNAQKKANDCVNVDVDVDVEAVVDVVWNDNNNNDNNNTRTLHFFLRCV